MASLLTASSRWGQTRGTGVVDSDTLTRTNVVALTGSRALTEADEGLTLRSTSETAVTITLPSDLRVGFEVGVIQAGAGQVTFAAGAGATLNNYSGHTKTAGIKAAVGLLVETAGVWNLAGTTAT